MLLPYWFVILCTYQYWVIKTFLLSCHLSVFKLNVWITYKYHKNAIKILETFFLVVKCL